MMNPILVYVGLGGNVGNSAQILQTALNQIAAISGVQDLQTSKFYQTTPVSDIPQRDFLNAVCRFKTILEPELLLRQLQTIEKGLGKIPKAQNEPRPIDLDILFYGNKKFKSTHLKIPHPAWKNRLFVLIPLSELVSMISVESEIFFIEELIKNLSSDNSQRVFDA